MAVPAVPVIGLEIHAQLITRTKLFCGCATTYGEAPNTRVCPVCLGLPGALPTLNAAAVEVAVRAALALGFRVNAESVFARKNYFYPDLPKGYQITQYDRPLAEWGSLPVEVRGEPRSVPLTRLHLEEDAGKSFHAEGPGRASTLVDFNRAGVPLIEIVTEPALESPEEAGALLRRLRQILVALGVCSGRMEEGSLRCDANVSLRGPAGELGAKVEVKNLNSFRFVERALRHEIGRQAALLRGGGAVLRETRLFDEASGTTASMRGKEESEDYRYFPEPDLRPLRVGPDMLEALRASLPELPTARRDRYVAAFGLARKDADILVDDAELCAYFEAVAEACGHPRAAANWVLGEVLRVLKGWEGGIGTFALKVPPGSLAELLRLVEAGKASHTLAKEAFARMADTGDRPAETLRSMGADRKMAPEQVALLVERILAENPEPASQFIAGREKAFGFLVGAAMRAAGGKADPGLVNRLLGERLRNRKP